MATIKVSDADAMSEAVICKWVTENVTDEISCSCDTAEEAKYCFNETDTCEAMTSNTPVMTNVSIVNDDS